MNACAAHVYKVQGCPDCQALTSSVYLRSLRREPNQEVLNRLYREYLDPPEDDRLDPRDILTDAVDPDGMVTRVRRLSWTEVLDIVERDAEGDVA